MISYNYNNMQTQTLIRILKFIVWTSGLYLSTRYNFHVIYFIISGLYFMFTNMGKREKGTLSAYSVFNQNFERLHGTMDPTEMFRSGVDRQKPKLVLETKKDSRQEQNTSKQEYFKNQSKYGNKPCFCGSSLKFKKCCLPAQRKRVQQQRRKRIQQERNRKAK